MPITKLHYLDLVDGRFCKTTAQDLNELFAAAEASERRDHLVVHIHGGLVSHDAASAAAEGLLRTYNESPAYPVFFLWNSDVLKVLANSLHEVAKEPVFWRLVRRLAQLLAGKLAETGDTRSLLIEVEPLMEVPSDPDNLQDWVRKREPTNKTSVSDLTNSQRAQMERELKGDTVILQESRAIAAGLRDAQEIEEYTKLRTRGGPPVRGSRQTLMSPAVLKEIAAQSPEAGTRSVATAIAIAKYGVQIAAAVIKRYQKRHDHGLLATISEEVARTLYADSIGSTVWTLMKNDTRDAFGDDASVFGGTAFVDRLSKWWKPGRQLTLVGHSTGAIYIGHLLERIDRQLPAEATTDVVFLAPACTFAFLNERLELLRRRVRGFRMFALHDAVETNYWEVPALYPASLLYMVSGLFEDPVADMPIVGMERYFSNGAPYDEPEIRAVSEWIAQRVVWSVSDTGMGASSGAMRHGGFNEDPSTRASLIHILRNGF